MIPTSSIKKYFTLKEPNPGLFFKGLWLRLVVGWLREMEEDAFVKFGRLWAPVWRTIKTVDVIQQHRHFFHYSYSFINGPMGTNLFLWTLQYFDGPKLAKLLSLMLVLFVYWLPCGGQ